MDHRLTRHWVGAAAVIALVLSGCSGDDTRSEQAGAGDSTTTPTTFPFDRGQIEAAYLAFEAALEKAGSEPVTPYLPELQALLTGAATEDVTRRLTARLTRGEAERPGQPPVDRTKVVDLYERDGRPVLVSCKVDNRVIYDTVTGEVTDGDGRTYLTLYTLTDEDGAWRIAYIQHVDIIEQVADCPEWNPPAAE